MRHRIGVCTITLQRAYWPTVHNWLRAKGETYQADSIGNLLELSVAPAVAALILDLLPAGAVVPNEAHQGAA